MTKSNKKLHQLSKYLSFVLRHRPDDIELHLTPDGWANVDELMNKMNLRGKNISIEDLRHIVSQDEKQRYSFSHDESRIRANQGHSIDIDLKLKPLEPPQYLFHGTAEKNIASIRQQGLQKRQRHHVHLSELELTAKQVGARYGKPVVLIISAQVMHQAGHQFYRSENNVWLTEQVPAQFIQFPAN